MGLRRKHKIYQVDEELSGLRINDMVTLEWQTTSDGDYWINAMVNVGEFIIDAMIEGSTTWEISDWQIVEVDFYLQSEFGKDIIFWEFENIDMSVEHFPSLHTWLKMAHEKGAW